MSFVSWQFALFLPLVFALYWQLPHRGRLLLLFAASYVFYGAWDARFLALLLTSTTVDFLCALAITGRRQRVVRVFSFACLPGAWLSLYSLLPMTWRNGPAITTSSLVAGGVFPVILTAAHELLWRQPAANRPRSFLILSLAINLGLLGFFKYFNFFAGSAASLLAGFGWHADWTLLNIILPVGISFYTFQSISYTVDVYRGRTQPTSDFPTFATYIAFFPQLVAGPIERSTDLLPQLQRPAMWDTTNFHRGCRLLLIGFFKKVFVADNCALLANYAFDPKTPLNGGWAVLGVLAFAFQIYGDFSGYSDIARGAARVLGIHLSRNFAFPYFARTPSEFWQRWNITLSSWFRDYVYIPLGGNRHGNGRTLRNLAITMLLAGLWHGASWTFVLWGGYYGVLLIVYRMVPVLNALDNTKATSRWQTIFSISLMWVLTLLGWALFRSQSMVELMKWFAALGNWSTTGAVDCIKPACWWLIHVVPLLLIQIATWQERDDVEIAHWHWPLRGLAYALLFLMVATSAVSDQEFIYFQF